MNSRGVVATAIAGLALLAAGCGKLPPPVDPVRARAMLFNNQADAEIERGNLTEAERFYAEALKTARSIEDFERVAINTLGLAATLRASGRESEAEALLDELLAAPAGRFPPQLIAQALLQKAAQALDAGRAEDALSHARRSLQACADRCPPPPAAHVLVARALLAQHDPAAAQAAAQAGLEGARSMREPREEANALRTLGDAALERDASAAAAGWYEGALDLDKRLGLPRKVALDLLGLATASQRLGRDADARELARRALAVANGADDEPLAARARALRSASGGAEATDEPAPRSRDYPWMSLASWRQRHEALVGIAAEERQQAELAFLGDSIVAGWDKAVWDERYSSYHALRLGLGGDKTQNLLWRIAHGELDGTSPRLLVLLIGTNNLGADGATPVTVASGISKVVATVRQKLPRTTVLVVGILPRDELPTSPVRQEIAATNAIVARLADGGRMRYVDIGPRFLEADGRIAASVMADFLHPTAHGYRIFADAIQPLLDQLLGPSAQAAR